MKWHEQIPRDIAAQLALGLAYVLAFQIQMQFPDIPGTPFASLIFIPALVRVFGTLYIGPRAMIGLFLGSLIVIFKFFPDEHSPLWRAFASAASAPLALWLFGWMGFLPRQGNPIRAGDPAMIFLFIACYAVINAGLHVIGLTIAGAPLAAHLPYFLVMVTGDVLLPAGGFGTFLLLRRGSQPKTPD